MCSKIFVGFVSILLVSHSYGAVQQLTPPALDTVKERDLAADCDSGYSVKCFKLDVVNILENYSSKEEFNVWPGVSVVRDLNASDVKNEDIASEMARNFPTDSEKRLDGLLFAKLTNFLETHTMRLNFFDTKPVEEACFIFTGRKGKIRGKKNGLKLLIAVAVLIKGFLGALVLGALALFAGKALSAALLALILSAVLGIKSLIGGHKQTTYEIISQPVYSQSSTHSLSHDEGHGGGGGHGGYGHYGRSLNFKFPKHLADH